jgi:hypothetical protein
MLYFVMWRRVVWYMITDTSEEYSTYIFSIEE